MQRAVGKIHMHCFESLIPSDTEYENARFQHVFYSGLQLYRPLSAIFNHSKRNESRGSELDRKLHS